jgi:hypothetical protein
MRFGVFMPKMSPNGPGFESSSGQITIFPIKSMLNAEESTQNCHRNIEYDYLH